MRTVLRLFLLLFLMARLTAASQPISIGQPFESANRPSYLSFVSDDGRRVGFISSADDLVDGDNNGKADLFLRDRAAGKTLLLSGAPDGSGGNGHCLEAIADKTGNLIVFASLASNLVEGDINGASDLFLRDLETGGLELISATPEGGVGNAASYAPQISSSGRYVLFESFSTNLASGDINVGPDIFLRDRHAGVTHLVTRSYASAIHDTIIDRGASNARISPDERYVIFDSEAGDLVLNDQNGRDLFLYDISSQANQRLRLSTGTPLSNAFFSEDGLSIVVLFGAGGSYRIKVLDLHENLTMLGELQYEQMPGSLGNVFLKEAGTDMLFDLVGGRQLELGDEQGLRVAVWQPQSEEKIEFIAVDGERFNSGSTGICGVSDDYQIVTFLSQQPEIIADPNASDVQLYQHDRSTSETKLLSVHPDGAPFRDPMGTAITSADGKLVAFDTAEEGLVPGDQNGFIDVFVQDVASGARELISVRDAGVQGLTAAGGADLLSGRPIMAGERIIFSATGRLVSMDLNNDSDLYWRDLTSPASVLVTADTNGLAPQRPWIHGPPITSAQLSVDGNAVLFATAYLGLIDGDTNGVTDVFLRDIASGETSLISVLPDGSVASGASYAPSSSADLRRIAFLTASADFFAGDTNESPDLIFVDLDSGLRRILTAELTGPWDIDPPVMDAAGERVAFSTTAISAFDGFPNRDVYLYDLTENRLELVSVPGAEGEASSHGPVFSRDGSILCYVSDSKESAADAGHDGLKIFARNLDDGTTEWISKPPQDIAPSDSWDPSVSADGSRICFRSVVPIDGLSNATNIQVYVRDRIDGETRPVSVARNSDTMANGRCFFADISPDGNLVLFSSTADNLTPGDLNGRLDYFIRDLELGRTIRINLPHSGFTVESGVYRAAWNWEGTAVVLSSPNASSDDRNGQSDIFVYHLGNEDSDKDSLPDEWELTYFDDLSRAGAEDFDGDGATDFEEYFTGTDPTDSGARFRVSRIEDLTTGEVILTWNAAPGREYAIEYTDDLTNISWRRIEAVVRAEGDLATYSLAKATDNRRFFRAVVVGAPGLAP